MSTNHTKNNFRVFGIWLIWPKKRLLWNQKGFITHSGLFSGLYLPAKPFESSLNFEPKFLISAFQRYVTQEDGERHLNPHWRSISYMCQPCRVAYQYIMDIETSYEDSAYVFKQLNFNTSLPGLINSSKTKKNPEKSKKQLEDYYKSIPKDLIKKVYAKYYLDFVLFGFSSSMVSQIVNSGIDKPSNYTKTSKYVWDNPIRFRNSYQFFMRMKAKGPSSGPELLVESFG